jgi:hypothetical protein
MGKQSGLSAEGGVTTRSIRAFKTEVLKKMENLYSGQQRH